MNERAAALIFSAEHVVLMRRFKRGREYYTLPGGSVEPSETPEAACLREIQEETGLMLKGLRPLGTLENRGRREHYFLAAAAKTDLRLGEPEASRQSEDNIYEPLWVAKDAAPKLNVQPTEVLTFIRQLL